MRRHFSPLAAANACLSFLAKGEKWRRGLRLFYVSGAVSVFENKLRLLRISKQLASSHFLTFKSRQRFILVIGHAVLAVTGFRPCGAILVRLLLGLLAIVRNCRGLAFAEYVFSR